MKLVNFSSVDGEIRHVGYGDSEAAAWMIAHDDMLKA